MAKDKKIEKIRADALLVHLGKAESSKQAQALIMAGKVVASGQRVDKAAQMLTVDAAISLKGQKPFVSRGGEKLAGALAGLGLEGEIKGKVVLDIGASTGGFTDCALQLGASLVLALDVGANQLHWSLRQHPQVRSLEQQDIRVFKPEDHPPVDWVFADISFNSLSRLASSIENTKASQYLLMVKPQFELARGQVPAGGVIADANLREEAVQAAIASLTSLGLQFMGRFDSPVRGRAGNLEIFIYLVSGAFAPETCPEPQKKDLPRGD